MKRVLLSLIFAGSAALALCQAPFTIVRPADGAKVREDVRILIPKNSVPKSGYVGIFLDGKFLEAVVPNLSGRYYEYMLDTKSKNISDGKHTIEAVLYVDYSDSPRIVDRSAITINVQNQANIPVPPAGLLLRYHFKAGTQLTYSLLQRVALNTITQQQQQLGGKAAEMPLDYEKIRMLYSIENTYGDGDGLLRLQAEPLKNKKYVMFTPSNGSTTPSLFYDTQMAAIYMRLTSTGMEVFGSVPEFIPTQGINVQGGTELFANWPLPTLPTKRVRPGDVWQTRFQVPKWNLLNLTGANSVIDSYPARGEFKGVEWEMGHPCAKIYHSMVTGGKPSAKGGISSNRTSMEETIWFALDKGQVIKMVRNQSYDTAGGPPSAGGAGGKTGTGGDAGAAGKGGGRRRPGAAGSSGVGGRGGAGGIDLNTPGTVSTPMMQTGKGGRRRGGAAGAAGAAGGAGDTGRFTGTRSSGAPTGGAGGGSLVRLSLQQIFILEQ